MNSEVIFIAGLITADHIFLKNEKNWNYIGSIGGGSAANVYFALKSFDIPVKLIGAVGNRKPNLLNIALKDINSYSKNNNLIYISENSETREYYHLIEKSNNHWNHKFSSSSPISNTKQTNSVQFRKSYFLKEFENSIDECKFFYMDRLSKSLLEFAELAKKRNILLIFDFGTISTRYLKEDLVKKAINLADVIQIPKKIFNLLKKSLQFETFHEINPDILIWIITDGENPIKTYHTNFGEIEIEVQKINNVIDSAGAGDAFMTMLIKQIFDLYDNHISLKSIDKELFIDVIQKSIMNARKACLFLGSRTYIYDYLNSKKNFSSLYEYLIKNFEIEEGMFEKSINLIENYGKKSQEINNEILCILDNKKVELIRGKGVFESNLLNLPSVLKYSMDFFEKEFYSIESGKVGHHLIVIGSGASYSVAKAIEQLFKPPNERFCVYAYTPFEYILNINETYPVCIISYSGTNPDIKSCFKKAIKNKSKKIFLLTGSSNSLLVKKISKLKNGFILPVKTPQKERGFVGVYSMISSISILTKFLYSNKWKEEYSKFISQKNLENLVKRYTVKIHKDFNHKLNKYKTMEQKLHIIALGTNWSKPTLVDLESKIIECNLGTIERSDLKNYTHGRYINLYKNPNNRLVIIFKTPETSDLANFLYSRFSSFVPVFEIKTQSNDFIGMIDLFIQMLVFVNELGKFYNQDPSKPGFPNEAKGLYNWTGLY